MNQLIIVSHFLSTFALMGLIWTIQWVHYPSFRFISSENFQSFHKFHSQHITAIVAPLMLLEILTATVLCFKMPSIFVFINFASVMLVWLLTAFISVPLHNQLSQGFQLELVNKLVTTNWPRTILWTIRAFIWGYILYKWNLVEIKTG